MTDEEAAVIAARAEAATAGPWEQPAYPIGDMVYRLVDRSPDGLIATCGRSTDAAFIAHAREDITALLTEVERLRQLLQVANDAVMGMQDMAGGVIERMRAENAHMREVVRAVASATPQSCYTAYLTPPPLPPGVTIEGMVQNFIELDEAWRDKARALLAGEDSQPTR